MNTGIIKSVLIGCGFAIAQAFSPLHAAQVLFDNGSAIDNAGQIGGSGYSSNQMSGWKVYDNFSFSQDLTIESVWFQMAGGTEPFVFAVYADEGGKPGKKIFSTSLQVGDYSFDNFRWYKNGTFFPDGGHDFSFDLEDPLTLAPGDYWVSFWGTGASRFYTLGTGTGDGFWQKKFFNGWMYARRGNTPFKLIGEPVDPALAEIDIKPDSDDNTVNPKSNGVITVAVLGSIDFDAGQVDYSTVVFGPGEATPVHDGHVEDVDGDGFMDMLFHFRTRETGIACDDSEASLRGETFAGDEFSATDSIDTVGCNDPGPSDDVMDEPLEDIVDEDDGASDEGGGPDAAAMDWSMLALMGILVSLALQRRRVTALRIDRKPVFLRGTGCPKRRSR